MAVSRRAFAAAISGLALGRPVAGARDPAARSASDTLTAVGGVKVGHFTETRRPTGCTVVLVEGGAVCGVDVRGGAPGTRETDLLDPVNTVDRVHAIVLSGGSAFGLEAATGVMRFLEEKGIGVEVRGARVPIVPAAILFDLGVGDGRIRPDAAAGYAAARDASQAPVAEGNVGAGAGATVGKLFGPERAMKGGLGSAAAVLPRGVVVGAVVAVNAVGDVRDAATGRILAGARAARGGFEDTTRAVLEGRAPSAPLAVPRPENTTIGVVATTAALSKAGATKVAQMAQDGLARTISPAHTPWDGDTLFALSTGEVTIAGAELVVGIVAAEVVARAVVRAVRAARGLPGLPAAGDLG